MKGDVEIVGQVEAIEEHVYYLVFFAQVVEFELRDAEAAVSY